MKNRFLILICIVTAFIGCEEIDKLTQFEMEFQEKIVIPSSTGVNLPLDISTPDLETNSESTFAVNKTRKDLIEKINLKKLDLILTSPSDSDLSFLESIDIFISAEGLSETKIAWKENIPDDVGKSLKLDVTDKDLKEYIKKDKFKLRLNTVTNKILTSDHKIDVNTVFFIDAKIFGL
ncbi:hypothetical protein [Aquimarina muelleri]|uniref:Uncharacterized protein n=1 Tax=Aquimarina muelleri TaxID=279356 RepID=A0A918JXG5_9FLAO|nr:hypothetical protein [Aquimarina muelleri]MCX2764151.1 hypothetical protein [Aquimarina muelleri]GGX31503.1 hypothetical protein GCM10007384_35640 [Aquimarina muelleri]